MNLRQLSRAIREAQELPNLNSLIYKVCRGPVYKAGTTVVAGILNHSDEIEVIASIGLTHCYDTRQSFAPSKIFSGVNTFSLPPRPRGAVFHIDDRKPVEKVGTLFLFEDVPFSCKSFIHSATIIGKEPLLREALRGKYFIPRYRSGQFAAMEILTDDHQNRSR